MIIVNGEWLIVNEEKNFYEPNNRINIKHSCVALLYALFINDLNVQVSDTRDDE